MHRRKINVQVSSHLREIKLHEIAVVDMRCKAKLELGPMSGIKMEYACNLHVNTWSLVCTRGNTVLPMHMWRD